MRFAVEYKGEAGRVGMIIFSADSLDHAQEFVEELNSRGQEKAFNLNELVEGTICELYRLYPRIHAVTVRGNVTSKGQYQLGETKTRKNLTENGEILRGKYLVDDDINIVEPQARTILRGSLFSSTS